MLDKLKRPLCFLDIESTGLDTENDRIVEISVCKIEPNNNGRTTKTKRFNPEIPISLEASSVHGITNEMVEHEKPFKTFAKGLLSFIQDCDMAGFKSNNFDFPMLNAEFIRAGVVWDYSKVNFIDVGNIYHIKEPRTLATAKKYYTGEDLVDSHSAEADNLATVEVLEKQFEKYPDLPTDLAELALFSNYDKIMVDLSGKFYKDKHGVICIGFGTHRGKPAISQESWLEWLVSDKAKGFSQEVKNIATGILEEIKNG